MDTNDLVYIWLNDRENFPRDIFVVTVSVEDDGYGRFRLRKSRTQAPPPTGENIMSEDVPLQEYDIDGARGLAGYNEKLKTLVIGQAK